VSSVLDGHPAGPSQVATAARPGPGACLGYANRTRERRSHDRTPVPVYAPLPRAVTRLSARCTWQTLGMVPEVLRLGRVRAPAIHWPVPVSAPSTRRLLARADYAEAARTRGPILGAYFQTRTSRFISDRRDQYQLPGIDLFFSHEDTCGRQMQLVGDQRVAAVALSSVSPTRFTHASNSAEGPSPCLEREVASARRLDIRRWRRETRRPRPADGHLIGEASSVRRPQDQLLRRGKRHRFR
jgi:hypothetical protein